VYVRIVQQNETKDQTDVAVVDNIHEANKPANSEQKHSIKKPINESSRGFLEYDNTNQGKQREIR
jgi:hypothetical protein